MLNQEHRPVEYGLEYHPLRWATAQTPQGCWHDGGGSCKHTCKHTAWHAVTTWGDQRCSVFREGERERESERRARACARALVRVVLILADGIHFPLHFSVPLRIAKSHQVVRVVWTAQCSLSFVRSHTFWSNLFAFWVS